MVIVHKESLRFIRSENLIIQPNSRFQIVLLYKDVIRKINN